jgi:hypothetical protein
VRPTLFTRLARHRARWDLAAAVAFTSVALLLYATAPLSYRPASDGYYSWVYARSLAYDGDLDFTNDYSLCGDPFEIGWTTAVQHRANFYYFGPAAFWTPAIWVVKHLVKHASSADVRNGCMGPVPFLVLWLTCFAGGAVVLATSALLRRWMSARKAAFAALLTGLGTPLLDFSSIHASASHAYDAASVAAYVYVVVLLRERGPRARLLVLAGALLGLAILQRSSNAIFGLLALGALAPRGPAPSWSRAARSVAAVAATAVLTGVVPLLLVTRAIYGHALLFAHGPYFLWPAHAHPFLLLFDERGGVFDTAPVLWLGVAGLAILLRKRDAYWLTLPWLACAYFELHLSASALDWQAGRRLLNLAPLGALCIGLACERGVSWVRARPRATKFIAYAVPVAVVGWLQAGIIFGFARGKIPWDTPLTAATRYSEGQKTLLGALEAHTGPLTELPAAYVFALRYHLAPSAFGWGAHPQWYQHNHYSLDYDRGDFSFTDHDARALLEGLEIKDGTRGACTTGEHAAAVFALQWPRTTRVRLEYDATGSNTLAVRSFPWRGVAALPVGNSQRVYLDVPPGGLDSGINQVELEHGGSGKVCLLSLEFVDDTRYPAAPEAEGSPPVHLWRSLPANIDGAAAPSVAAGHDATGPWVLEVNETASPGIDARIGIPRGELGPPTHLSYRAFAPRVAADPVSGTLIEIEQAQREEGGLWARTGHVERQNGNPVVTWAARAPYATGVHPAVAIAADLVVEVHSERDRIAMRTARVDAGRLVWADPQPPHATGCFPAVAMTSAEDGVWIAEAWQTETKYGPMNLRFGRVGSDGAIAWRDAKVFDTGLYPQMAIYGHTIVEAHQGQEDVGGMWLRTGTFKEDGTVTWRRIKKYDDGGHPVIALDAASGTGLELHESSKGFGGLWMHDLDVY